MRNPMVFVGIGTTGLKVLEQIQKFYFEATGKPKPPNVSYLFIETNEDNKVDSISYKNSIDRVFISLENSDQMIEKLRDTASWLPQKNSVIQATMGAGGVRACGRLALWGTNNKGNNFLNVYQSISNAINQARTGMNAMSATKEETMGNGSARVDSNVPIVFVVGSLVGGTGSGVFIDIAYMVRQMLNNVVKIYSLFLIPRRGSGTKGSESGFANTYTALRDLSYFNSTGSNYKEKWPNKVNVDTLNIPFDLTQVLSGDYQGSLYAPIQEFGGLIKMAGLYLFLNMVGLYHKRYERLVDAGGSEEMNKYSSFGLSGIHYPKDQIQEYIAIKLNEELYDRWLDDKSYFLNDSAKPIDNTAINRVVRKEFDRFLIESFENLNNIGNRNIPDEIIKEAGKINRKEISKDHDNRSYLRELFGSHAANGYYKSLFNNLQIPFNVLIENISDLSIEYLDKRENLYFSRTFLEELVRIIDEQLKFWTNEYKVNDSSEKWEDTLGKKIDWVLGWVIMGEKDKIVADRMTNTLEHLKMHLMYRKLQDLKNHIQTGKNPLYATSSKKTLPMLSDFEKVIAQIREARKENHKRMLEIEADINDKTIPIKRIFVSGRFKRTANEPVNGDVENSLEKYKQDAKLVSKNDVGIAVLWNFFNTEDPSKYKDIAKKYKAIVDNMGCVEEYNVSEFVANRPDIALNTAQQGIPVMLSIDRVIERSLKLPRLIACRSNIESKAIRNKFKDQNYLEFHQGNDADSTVGIDELKNMVIFYNELSMFVPLKDLTYADEMKECYLKPSDSTTASTQNWKNLREAYVIDETKIDE